MMDPDEILWGFKQRHRRTTLTPQEMDEWRDIIRDGGRMLVSPLVFAVLEKAAERYAGLALAIEEHRIEWTRDLERGEVLLARRGVAPWRLAHEIRRRRI